MAQNKTAPGTYFETSDFSDYSPALATTSCGIVGEATKGPLNEATFCSSVEDFTLKFGEPNSYGAYAAVNYLRQGNQAYFVRVAKSYDHSSTLVSVGAATDGLREIVTLATGHGVIADDYIELAEPGKPTHRSKVASVTGDALTLATKFTAEYTIAASVLFSKSVVAAGAAETFLVGRRDNAVSNVVHVKAKDPGSWANFGTSRGLEIKIADGGNFANIDPTSGIAVLDPSGYALQGVSTSRASVDSITDLYELTSGDVRPGAMVGVNNVKTVFSVSAIAEGTTADTVKITLPGVSAADSLTAGNLVRVRGTLHDVALTSVAISSVAVDGNNTEVVLPLAAVVVSATIVATIENLSATTSQALVFRCISATGSGSTWSAIGVLTKKMSVYYRGRLVEVFENLIGYDSSSPNFWDVAVQSDYITVEYVGTGQQPINSLTTANPNNPRYLVGLTMSVRTSDSDTAAFTNVYAVRGEDGSSPEDADYIFGLQPMRRKETYAIDLIAVPGVSSASVVNEMMAIAEYRDDSLALVDPPLGLSKQGVVDWHNGQGDYAGEHDAFTGSYGALFYPWVRQYDPYSRTQVWVPPSAVVAGQIAYSDSKGETWFAPAGITRGTITSATAVEVQLEDGDVEMMYGPANGNAINPIRQFEKDGIVIFGQRTLQRYPSALDRINVRRLVSHIIKSARSSVRRLSFEQNDEILWSQARGVLSPLMINLKGRRAIEFFSILCDERNNTALRRNQNQVRVDVQIIPTKSGEVVTVGLNLFPSGVTVEQITSVVTSL